MKWSEAFAILEKYGLSKYDVYAEHDEIYVDKKFFENMTAQDKFELELFGFYYSEEHDVYGKFV